MIFNFGSINIDHVYRVSHLPAPGETLAARSLETHLGGKGINQSIAVSRAGGSVRHIGAVGPDGNWAISQIESMGVDPSHIARVEAPTGNAVIYVDDNGENSIVILSGANGCLSEQQIRQELSQVGSGDWVVFQNETNLVPQIAAGARQTGCRIAYSAAPFVPEITLSLLCHIDLLVVNEGEALALAHALGIEVEDIPVPKLLITRGSGGSTLRSENGVLQQNAFEVSAVDTTGAGDTFLGSFLAYVDLGKTPAEALRYASAASAVQVTREGAATAIPSHDDVMQFLNARE